MGAGMIEAFYARLNARGAFGYRETDKAEIRFSEKLGFSTVAETKVLGVQNWFMARSARV